ncbi:MAG: hypothetical protein IM537_17850 [Pseudanabaena sp. M57BS1SP1A06MG]|jgi:hypothetical protein|nr:hypothetical protein [Pseudanabaena sp. M53BS1SP1A06MG]MCA6582705.1 hypothetical protein [Pseudanabaena sp. M34BS1SP1A06MG]MCA6592988.1 hypothetical protein [Pseudanabaena sp. M38BS1SP1A06MG]MCA6597385.1 hypothetical protein [Pseudanabaena sp. M046S1SP1A06QC]MCA6602016.1 hypothetical protein [Pseudanabaena sp. M57BS1SP1A06MG]
MTEFEIDSTCESTVIDGGFDVDGVFDAVPDVKDGEFGGDLATAEVDGFDWKMNCLLELGNKSGDEFFLEAGFEDGFEESDREEG